MRVLYLSEVQWRSQVSRKHLMIRRFPETWSTLFLSPMNARASENSLGLRHDERWSGVSYRTIPHAKPDSTIGVVRAMTPALARWGRRRIAAEARAFEPDAAVISFIWAAPSIGDLHGLGIPVLYDCNDLHYRFYPPRGGQTRERFGETVRWADEVVCSSEYLAEVCGRGTVIGNGVDLETFTGRLDVARPERIAGSALSDCVDLVSYVGSIDERIDFGMLEAVVGALADRDPRSGLVCVGRIFESARRAKEDLERRYPGHVLFTGRVPYEELPRYLSHTRVGVAPFVLTEKTKAINPNKLYVYAAMEQGIVSTPFSPEVRSHEDLVRIATEPDGFAAAVTEALGDDERRRAVRERIALPNSWNVKTSEFVSLLADLAERGYSG